MDTETELRTNEYHITDHIKLLFASQYVTFDQKRKILWPKFYCLISLNPSETLVCNEKGVKSQLVMTISERDF